MPLRKRALLVAALLCGAPAGASAAAAEARVSVRATGSVEVFVNGAAIARSVRDGDVVVARASLLEGARNVVVLRASAGSAAAPAVVGELHGAFGRVGTTARWTARRADGSEATDPTGPWALPGGGAGWSAATEVAAAPPAGFPAGGPARGIWTAARDATVLARLELFVPPGLDADRPQGFGHAVTGGAGGAVVRPGTLAELATALCGSRSGGACTDATPRVIEIAKEFDFVGSEGTRTEPGCYGYTICSDAARSELLLDGLGQCGSKARLDVTYDAAGVNPLLVGSNKTLVGVGDGARIRGKGITIRGGVHNVVVRNVTVTDVNPQVVWGGDAITIDDADGVWIDHVRVSLVGRQMLVTGFGKASNVTFSWNELDGRTPYAAYCDGAHYWVSLNLGKADTITLLGNWIHHTSGRGPHAGGYAGVDVLMHLVDNAYEDVTGHALNPMSTTSAPQSRVVAEANHFARVAQPVMLDANPGLLFAPAADAESCRAAIGRPCLANVAAPAPASGWPPPVDAAALAAVGAAGAGTFPAAFAASEVPAAVPHLAGVGHVGPYALPDFRLVATPAAVRVDAGANAASTVTVVPVEGFASAVAVAASGAPAGVTATIAPGGSAGTSTVTLTAAASAAAGTSPVIVTGTGGGLTRTATLTVEVVRPAPGPAPTPDPTPTPTPTPDPAPTADPAPRVATARGTSCASAGGADGAVLAAALLLARAASRGRPRSSVAATASGGSRPVAGRGAA